MDGRSLPWALFTEKVKCENGRKEICFEKQGVTVRKEAPLFRLHVFVSDVGSVDDATAAKWLINGT